MSRLAVWAFAVPLLWAAPSSAQSQDEVVADPWGVLPPVTGEAAPWPQGPRAEVSDPRAPIGAVLVASGGLLVGAGASLFADVGPNVTTFETSCTPSGCFTSNAVERDVDAESAPVALMAGGAATGLFGGVLLAHSFGDGQPFPHKSTGRLGAGMLLTGYGVGTTVGASALLMHAAIEGSELAVMGFVMYAPAVGMLASGIPLWITGSRPAKEKYTWKDADKEGTTKEVLRSPTMGSIGLGVTALGLGVGIAGIAATVEGDRREQEEQQERGSDDFFVFGSDRPEPIVTVLGTSLAGVMMISLGLPLAIIGLGTTSPSEAHASAPTLSLPEVSVGPGGANVIWHY